MEDTSALGQTRQPKIFPMPKIFPTTVCLSSARTAHQEKSYQVGAQGLIEDNSLVFSYLKEHNNFGDMHDINGPEKDSWKER